MTQPPQTARHVAFVFLDLNGGGIERTMLVLAGEFARRGYRADIVIMRSRGVLMDQVPEGVRLVELGIEGMRAAHLRGIRAFARYLRKERPDGIVSAAPMLNLVAILGRVLARSKARLVTSDRNDPKVAHYQGGRLKRMVLPRLTRWLYPLADVNAAVSDGVRDALALHLRRPPERLATVYNPKDITPLPDPRPRHRWLRDKGTRRVILGVGRMHPQKNFPALIEAFAQLARTDPQLHLVIFGDGALRPEIEARAAASGLADRIDLPGFTHTIRDELAAADLFVLSSFNEGLPNVLIEALIEGTPVVATDCRFGPDEILMGGKLGALVPVGDTGALKVAMETTLASPPAPAPRAALERFSTAGAADAYAALLFPEDAG